MSKRTSWDNRATGMLRGAVLQTQRSCYNHGAASPYQIPDVQHSPVYMYCKMLFATDTRALIGYRLHPNTLIPRGRTSGSASLPLCASDPLYAPNNELPPAPFGTAYCVATYSQPLRVFLSRQCECTGSVTASPRGGIFHISNELSTRNCGSHL